MANSVIDNSEVARLAGAVSRFHSSLDGGLEPGIKERLAEIFLGSIMNERAIALAGPSRVERVITMED